MKENIISRRGFIKNSFMAAAIFLTANAGVVNAEWTDNDKMLYDKASRAVTFPKGNLVLQLIPTPDDTYDKTDFKIINIEYDGESYSFHTPSDFIIIKDGVVILTKNGPDTVAEAAGFKMPLVVTIDGVIYTFNGKKLSMESSIYKNTAEKIHYNTETGVTEYGSRLH